MEEKKYYLLILVYLFINIFPTFTTAYILSSVLDYGFYSAMEFMNDFARNLINNYTFINLASILCILFISISILSLILTRLNFAILSGIISQICNGYLISVSINTFRYYLNIVNLVFTILNIAILILSINLLIYLYKSRKRVDINEETKIRQILLDAGTKFSRIKIKEISEYSKVDKTSIISIIQKMIQNKEIHGEYFKSSRSISFNQIANIEEIDNLLEIYNKWEEESIEKV